MVNEQQLRGSWNEIQGQLRKHWGQLNQDDVLAFGGNVDQLVGMIQRKTGDSRETIENFLNHLVEQGAQLIEEARQEAARIVTQARQAAEAEAGVAAQRAKEALREQVAVLAVAGAERILRKEINAQVHADLLANLKQELK